MSAIAPVHVERFTYSKKDVLRLVDVYKRNLPSGIHVVSRAAVSCTGERHPKIQWYEMAECVHALNLGQEVSFMFPDEVIGWMREGLAE